MDATSTLAGPLARAFASGFATLNAALRLRVESRKLGNLTRQAREQLAIVLSANSIPSTNSQQHEDLCWFLSSNQFHDLAYQTVLIQATIPSATTEQTVRRQLFNHISTFLPDGLALDMSETLSASMIAVVDTIVQDERNQKVFRHPNLREDAATRLTTSLLSSIDHQLEIVSRALGKKSPHELHLLAKRYRTQAQARFRKITPPNFGSPRSIDLKKIYVPPRLINSSGTVIELDDLTAELHRTLILGDPGGGKSTLVRFAILLASSGRGIGKRKGDVPFLITLREYARSRNAGTTIAEYIAKESRTLSQISDIDTSIVEYFLSTGSALVVFDGLDELLDVSLRQDIVIDVQQFCELYPTTPVLVTSRKVGYDQAPLDPEVFQPNTIAEFEPNQTKDYVTKWFNNAPDLRNSERVAFATDFLQAASVAEDLASNPLMLSLMCNLYRGDRYIPRNRPELYEKCATWLFERWDGDRDIVVPLPFKEQVRPAMMAIASAIYQDETPQEGIRQSDLIAQTTDHLLETKFELSEDAEEAARQFVEFCTGRAWVFTDVGATIDEPLFQFTHRTFLEYFAAAHLVRTHPTVTASLAMLRSHIEQAEWDVVAQLVVQMVSRNIHGAADDILLQILDWSENLKPEKALNCITFAVRCLEFLEPRESTVTRIVESSIEAILAGTESDFDHFDTFGLEYSSSIDSMGILGGLSRMLPENRPPTVRTLGTVIDRDPLPGFFLQITLESRFRDRPVRDQRTSWAFDTLLEQLNEGVPSEDLGAAHSNDLYSSRLLSRFVHESAGLALDYRDVDGLRDWILPAIDASRSTLYAPVGYSFLQWLERLGIDKGRDARQSRNEFTMTDFPIGHHFANPMFDPQTRLDISAGMSYWVEVSERVAEIIDGAQGPIWRWHPTYHSFNRFVDLGWLQGYSHYPEAVMLVGLATRLVGFEATSVTGSRIGSGSGPFLRDAPDHRSRSTSDRDPSEDESVYRQLREFLESFIDSGSSAYPHLERRVREGLLIAVDLQGR